jgi:hypothetical protein
VHITDREFIRALPEVLNEHTPQAVGSHIARGIGARDVTQHLEALFTAHGRPAFIRADNGRDFIADTPCSTGWPSTVSCREVCRLVSSCPAARATLCGRSGRDWP